MITNMEIHVPVIKHFYESSLKFFIYGIFILFQPSSLIEIAIERDIWLA